MRAHSIAQCACTRLHLKWIRTNNQHASVASSLGQRHQAQRENAVDVEHCMSAKGQVSVCLTDFESDLCLEELLLMVDQ